MRRHIPNYSAALVVVPCALLFAYSYGEAVTQVADVAVEASESRPESEPRDYSKFDLLDAIREVESGGQTNPRDGDGGRSIGPYQISMAYFVDSMVRGGYQQCRERAFAEGVVKAYFERYRPGLFRDYMTLSECETLARLHNGGPKGPRRESTLPYWRKVREVLTRGD